MFDPFDPDWLERLGIPRTYFKLKTKEYRFWFRALYEKLDSRIDFKGIPDEWPKEFLKFLLWANGKCAVFSTEQWGKVVSLITAMSGFNFYWQPTKISVSSPLYTNILTLHKDVEVVHLTPNFTGVFDLLDFYSTRLSELSKSIQIGIINSKLPCVLAANSKQESELLKAIYDQIQSGESLIVYKNKLNSGEILPRKEMFTTWMQDFRQTYIVTELLDNMEKILNQFYMEIGLTPQLEDSKAHTLNAEMGAQNEMSCARFQTWINCLEESIDHVNKLFGMNMEVEYAQSNVEANGDALEESESSAERNLGAKK